ncbi:hypothetical protein DPMN_087580 [Dreissena polymorpha]|uniref:Uncharacterized protein n=1 Tax=Dreissena polymorpha TaxID=45954 RepID=A0A9D4KSM3_DREPO|nr:hypothetical protein DPMN_087580 [Dreissena polymorpha]
MACYKCNMKNCEFDGQLYDGQNVVTKAQHEEHTSRVLPRTNAPPLAAMFFSTNRNNFKTRFHEDWTINVTSRVLTRENCSTPGCHPRLGQILLTRKTASPLEDIFSTNHIIRAKYILTKFHEDGAINVRMSTKDDEQMAITKAHLEHIVPR